jgi:HEAT repeat protein
LVDAGENDMSLDLPTTAIEPVERLMRACKAADTQAIKNAVGHMIDLMEGKGIWDSLVFHNEQYWVPAVLVKLGKPVVPLLIGVLQHKDPTILWYTVDMLVSIGDPSAVPGILELLEKVKASSNRPMILHLIDALDKIGDDRVVPALTELNEKLDHSTHSEIIRDAANRVIQKLTGIRKMGHL